MTFFCKLHIAQLCCLVKGPVQFNFNLTGFDLYRFPKLSKEEVIYKDSASEGDIVDENVANFILKQVSYR